MWWRRRSRVAALGPAVDLETAAAADLAQKFEKIGRSNPAGYALPDANTRTFDDLRRNSAGCGEIQMIGLGRA